MKDKAINAGSLVEVKKEESTQIAKENVSRSEISIGNDSENYIYIFLGTKAEVGKGLKLPPGQTYINNTYTGEITGAAKTAKSNVCVVEV